MDRRGTRNIVVRFLEKVDIKPGKCWEWQGATNKNGYGVLRIAKEKRNVLAHRYSLEFITGCPIPEDKDVCHTCDNPRCVNPEHLYLGDAYSNVHDMINRKRDRKAFGTNVHTAKLNENKVREIRRLYEDSGWTMAMIANLYGVGRNAIASVIRRKTWKWVD